MKKEKIAIVSISAILLFMFIAIIYNKKITFKEDGITYALTVNGVKQNSFPSKGMYRVDTECSNATCKWDYENWKLYIENITGKVSCNISFTTISKTNLNNYIIGLSGTTQGSGSLVNEKGYRFEGQDPNNYVWFNNELWRIIGVFDQENHGQSGLNLTKIIRNESIGSLAWNAANTNDWNNASLKKLLNNEYLNSTDGTNGDNCYGYSTTTKTNCDYRITGIKNVYRGMIKEVTWYLGGDTSSSSRAEFMYGYERDATKKYSSNQASINAKIGLMYASDYGYALLPFSSCTRQTILDYFDKTDCTLNDWLHSSQEEWTIMPYYNGAKNVGPILSNGRLQSRDANYGFNVRPALYLNENVYVLDGDGSITDPYIIGM